MTKPQSGEQREKHRGGGGGDEAEMEGAPSRFKRTTRSKSRQAFERVNPNKQRRTRSAVAKNSSTAATRAENPGAAPRRSGRLAQDQDQHGHDNSQLAGLPARARVANKGWPGAAKAKPAVAAKERTTRSRAAKKGDSKKAEPTNRKSVPTAKPKKKQAAKPKQAPKRGRKRARSEEDDGAVPYRNLSLYSDGSKPADGPCKKQRGASSDSVLEAWMQPQQPPPGRANNLQAAVVTHHNLAMTPFDPSKFTVGLSAHDTPAQGRVLYAPEYASDIFQRLFHSETHYSPQRYLHNQSYITASMRAVMVDWMLSTHMKWRLVPESLHLAVNIMDRFLSDVEIDRASFQLVGVTSLLIAAKYEEIYPPEVKDCVYITDRAFTKQDVIDMEADILGVLRFNLCVPTGYPFLERFLFITNATKTMADASKYYLERMLQEHDALDYRPSLIAAAAVCLAINHPNIRETDGLAETPQPGVPKELVEYTGFAPERIYQTAEFVADKVANSVLISQIGHKLTATKIKWSKVSHSSVAKDFEAPDAIDLFVS